MCFFLVVCRWKSTANDVAVLCVLWRRFCIRTFTKQIHLHVLFYIWDSARFDTIEIIHWILSRSLFAANRACLRETTTRVTRIDHWECIFISYDSLRSNERGHTITSTQSQCQMPASNGNEMNALRFKRPVHTKRYYNLEVALTSWLGTSRYAEHQRKMERVTAYISPRIDWIG